MATMLNKDGLDWYTFYHRLLIKYASVHYCNWKRSRRGVGFNNKDNPYRRGYSQPAWMNDMREALGKMDEERIKAIYLVESQYCEALATCAEQVRAEAR